jgi:hypothetical protein
MSTTADSARDAGGGELAREGRDSLAAIQRGDRGTLPAEMAAEFSADAAGRPR